MMQRREKNGNEKNGNEKNGNEKLEKEKIGKKKNRVTKVALGIIIIILLSVLINFYPTFKLKTSSMSMLSREWVDVYYEKEEAAAADVFEYADAEIKQIALSLGFDTKQDIRIFIYDSQKTMQEKKYGFIGPLLGLDWYIGDNIGTDVILASTGKKSERNI